MSDEFPLSRRSLLGAGVAALTLGATAPTRAADPAPAFRFRLRETAGLRRFGYPVHAVLPAVPAGSKLRLELKGKAVPAQFRKTTTPDGKDVIALDFTSSLGPLESEDYAVFAGDHVTPSPEPKGGMRVKRENGSFVVSNGNALAYTFAEGLDGFFKSVTNAKLEFVKASGGLTVGAGSAEGQPRAQGPTEIGSLKGAITREGPLCAALRFVGEVEVKDRSLKTTVDLTCPSSKSWVQADISVDDPDGDITRLGLATHLLIEGSPTLVDFGANNTVYATLKDEQMLLSDGPNDRWEILKTRAPNGKVMDDGSLFAVQAGDDPSEGWAHVMDKARSTALAVNRFGERQKDGILIGSDGQVSLSRQFEPQTKGPKALRFWFHFVTSPVQIGALTSPQAMLAPLEVSWSSEK